MFWTREQSFIFSGGKFAPGPGTSAAPVQQRGQTQSNFIHLVCSNLSHFCLGGVPATFQHLLDWVLRPHAAYSVTFWMMSSYTVTPGQRMWSRCSPGVPEAGGSHGQPKEVYGWMEGGTVSGVPLGRLAGHPKTKKEVSHFLGLAGQYPWFAVYCARDSRCKAAQPRVEPKKTINIEPSCNAVSVGSFVTRTLNGPELSL